MFQTIQCLLRVTDWKSCLTEEQNGTALVHACEGSGLVLSNTFCKAGRASTWWSPDGNPSHCLDFVAVPQEIRSRMKSCNVDKVFGRRWQPSHVRDHWPVEVVVTLPAQWVLLHKPRAAIRWYKHALQAALDDMSVSEAFLVDCEQALLTAPPLADVDFEQALLTFPPLADVC